MSAARLAGDGSPGARRNGARPCVWVFGSIHMDIVAFAARHPRTGETVVGSHMRLIPGGKGANQAVAARRAGVPTKLVGRVGSDAFGEQLCAFLASEDLDLSHTVSIDGVETGTALIVVADSDNTIVSVSGASGHLDAAAASAADLRSGDVVVAQCETPREATAAAFARARAAGAITVLNPAPVVGALDGLLAASDIIVVNVTELAELTGVDDPSRLAGARAALTFAKRLRTRDEQTVVVTRGAGGIVVATPGRDLRVAAHRVRAVDTTGAGDCFVGNLAAALCGGSSIVDAVDMANRAASLCVQTVGGAISMPSRELLNATRDANARIRPVSSPPGRGSS